MSPAKKSTGGRRSALDMLTRSHARLSGVLAELRVALLDADDATIDECLGFLRGPYHRHIADEEETVFPVLRAQGAPAVRRLVDELVVEHRQHETLIERVRSSWHLGDGASASAALAALTSELLAHSDKEERILWPAIRALPMPCQEAFRREMQERRPGGGRRRRTSSS